MADRLNVLVLGGGPDRERTVSIRSAAAVETALREAGHTVLQADVTPENDSALQTPADVVFPVLHGRFGEGGPLQRLLEAHKLRYVGARPRAAAVAMDKCAAKQAADRLGVPTPPYQQLGPRTPLTLEPPLVIKPLTEGSSFGVELCETAEQAAAARARQNKHFAFLLAERCVRGREITVGIVGRQILPAIEILPKSGFYDFEAKYESDQTEYNFEIDLPQAVLDKLNEYAWTMFEGIDCRHLARVDFLVDADQRPWFLEINTMPGFTDHSLIPMAAAKAGMPMPDLCDRLVRLATEGANSR
jgi:D-alanine-D-alanine ligase